MSETTGSTDKLEMVRLAANGYEALAKLWKDFGLSSLRPMGRDNPKLLRLLTGRSIVGMMAPRANEAVLRHSSPTSFWDRKLSDFESHQK